MPSAYKNSRTLKDYMIPNYEILHTQSKEYIVADIIEYMQAEEWLDYIVECRRGRCPANFDAVIEDVANDKVFDTIELFLTV